MSTTPKHCPFAALREHKASQCPLCSPTTWRADAQLRPMSALTDVEKVALANVGITSPEQHHAGTVGWLNAKDRIAAVERIVAEREAAAKAEALREAADDLAVAYSQSFDGQAYPAPAWLRDRADQIEACSCGAPGTYSLNPAEVVMHRQDGPCYIARREAGQ